MGAHHPVDGGGASYSAVIADRQASVHGKMHSSHIAAQDWKKMRRSQCLTVSLLFLLPSSPGTTAADTQQPGWESRRRWQRDARAAAARLWWHRSQTVITVIPKPNHCQHYDDFQTRHHLAVKRLIVTLTYLSILFYLPVGRNYGWAAGSQPEGNMCNYWSPVCRHRRRIKMLSY